MDKTFRLCLADLSILEGDPSNTEIDSFIVRHEHCKSCTVKSPKSRQFWAARAASLYLRQRHNDAPHVLSDLSSDEDEEEEDSDEEMREAVARIEATNTTILPPDGIDQVL